MRIPLSDERAAAGINLYEANAAFRQPARQQQPGAEVGCLGTVEPVGRACLRRFPIEIDRFRSMALHPEGEFITGDSRLQHSVVRSEIALIQFLHEVERLLLLHLADAFRRLKIENRTTPFSKECALMDSRQEAGARAGAPPSGTPSGCGSTQ